jgi:hypothetical protein
MSVEVFERLVVAPLVTGGLPVEGAPKAYRGARMQMPFAADFNGDGCVDANDSAIVKQCYKGFGNEPGGVGWIAGLNCDGTVGAADYVLFAEVWNGSGKRPRSLSPTVSVGSLRWWDEFKYIAKWSTCSQNCSTTAADALKAGNPPFMSHHVIWQPTDVEDYADGIRWNLNRKANCDGSFEIITALP